MVMVSRDITQNEIIEDETEKGHVFLFQCIYKTLGCPFIPLVLLLFPEGSFIRGRIYDEMSSFKQWSVVHVHRLKLSRHWNQASKFDIRN